MTLPRAFVLELACDGLDGQCSRQDMIVAPNADAAWIQAHTHRGWRKMIGNRYYCPQCAACEQQAVITGSTEAR